MAIDTDERADKKAQQVARANAHRPSFFVHDGSARNSILALGERGSSLTLGKGSMSQLRRLTIFADDPDDTPAEDVLWVRAWLDRWKSKVRIADYSSGGWEHLWNVEGPEEAIAEVPVRLHCCSEWANPEIFGDK